MIIPYKPAHALAVSAQKWQSDFSIKLEYAEIYKHGLCAYTCFCTVTRKPVACAGLLPIWEGRALAWALLSVDARKHMCEITRKMQVELDACPCRRVEMYVHPGFHEAARWARILGFEFEAILEEANPTGGDMMLFKRIKR